MMTNTLILSYLILMQTIKMNHSFIIHLLKNQIQIMIQITIQIMIMIIIMIMIMTTIMIMIMIIIIIIITMIIITMMIIIITFMIKRIHQLSIISRIIYLTSPKKYLRKIIRYPMFIIPLKANLIWTMMIIKKRTIIIKMLNLI